MTEWMDYYKILQVQHFADPEVVKAAYKKLCVKYHPDSSQNCDGGETIKKLNRAYTVLKNESSRKKYDIEWTRHNINNINNNQKGSNVSREERTAKKVMSYYFTCLSGKLYEDAYALLSDCDKGNIPFEHFVQWQSNVTNLYTIRNFQIVRTERCADFLIEGSIPCTAERIQIVINEENRKASIIDQYTMHKFAVYENDKWSVYLGYRDVLSLSRRIMQQLS